MTPITSTQCAGTYTHTHLSDGCKVEDSCSHTGEREPPWHLADISFCWQSVEEPVFFFSLVQYRSGLHNREYVCPHQCVFIEFKWSEPYSRAMLYMLAHMLTYSDIPCASRVRFNQACSLNDNALLSTLSFAATSLIEWTRISHACLWVCVCEIEVGGCADRFMFCFVYDLKLWGWNIATFYKQECLLLCFQLCCVFCLSKSPGTSLAPVPHDFTFSCAARRKMVLDTTYILL